MAKPPIHTETKLVRMSPELIAAITEWRRQQSALPSESEAIRRLIELGLQAAQQEVGKNEKAEPSR